MSWTVMRAKVQCLLAVVQLLHLLGSLAMWLARKLSAAALALSNLEGRVVRAMVETMRRQLGDVE